jgi:RNA polymerase sigma-70 factor, ECF subfamily
VTAQPQNAGRRGAEAADPAGRGVGPGPAPVRAVTTFESFYERELKAVIGLAYALSGSRTAAEDLAQDAFLAAHRSWDKIGRYDKPEAWVRRVVANMSVSLFRRTVREARALARIDRSRAILPELPAEDHEFWRAVRSLPKRQAQAVALHYLEDRSVADIAEILGCAEGTVKVHLQKGRIRLAATLGLEAGT